MVAGTESGDAHVVKQLPEGVLAAVIDGVGHGDEAADAARIAGRTLTSSPHEDTVSLVWRCHEALKETRGVVMTLAVLLSPGGAMTWIGVGNIEACDLPLRGRPDAPAPIMSCCAAASIGHRLPPLHAECLTMLPHDTVILATDGIRPEFSDDVRAGATSRRRSPIRSWRAIAKAPTTRWSWSCAVLEMQRDNERVTPHELDDPVSRMR